MKIHVHLHLARADYKSLEDDAGAHGQSAEVWMENILRRAAKEFTAARKALKTPGQKLARAR